MEYDNLLDTIGCGYLRDYEVVVCNSMKDGVRCGYAVPLESLMSHCYNKAPLASPRWSHEVPFGKISRNGPNDKQKRFMQEILGRYPNIVATIGELRDLRPLPNQSGPIQYIRPPIDGRVCFQCDFALSEETGDSLFRKHWYHHPGNKSKPGKKKLVSFKDRFGTKTPIQAFELDTHTRVWLAVRNPYQDVPTSQKPKFTGTLLGRKLLRHPAAIASLGLNETTILPFFTQIGAAQHIDPYNPAALAALLALPERTDHLLLKLRRAVADRFEDLCASVNTANGTVRQLLATPKPGRKAMSERFSAPRTKRSRASYALEEFRLLCLILRSVLLDAYTVATSLPAQNSSDSRLSSDDQYRLTLSAEQLEASQLLLNLLRQLKHDDPKIKDGIEMVLFSVYMPKNTLQMFDDSYINPVVAYICLRSVDSDGGFLPPSLLTNPHVKTQFCIRLFILEFIRQQYQAYVRSLAAPPAAEIKIKRTRRGGIVLDDEDEVAGVRASGKMPTEMILAQDMRQLLSPGGLPKDRYLPLLLPENGFVP
ncbi:hypothetical protein BDR06DRAFT_1015619 [Suillus hirtellus]|nr:hypothetical protein BDR06DRAFT_1015619 [Suillus hirtellus]